MKTLIIALFVWIYNKIKNTKKRGRTNNEEID